ncbi:MAG: OmpA family protein [Nitrospiria bacterium]
MKQQTFRWIAATSVLIPFLFGGCVTKSRFETQVAETQSLSEQLQNQTRKRAMLEEELSKLKRQLKMTESNLADARQAAADQETTLGNRIGVLEEQLALSKDMGSKTQQELKNKMIKLKGEHETDIRKKKQEIASLEAELAERVQAHLALQDLLSERDAELANIGRILDKVRERFQVTQEEAAQRERELKESNKARKNLVGRLKKEISEGSIKISQIKNRLTVEIVDKILFSSGSSEVTNKGKAVLAKVSSVLKSVKENDIRIEGHTDNVPIGPRIKKKFPTNWELSTSRATQVVRFLSEQGVDPNNLIALGLSQYRPIASNDTEEGKQRNRRIEIVLFPKDIQKITE